MHPHVVARLADQKRSELLTIARGRTRILHRHNVRLHRWRRYDKALWPEGRWSASGTRSPIGRTYAVRNAEETSVERFASYMALSARRMRPSGSSSRVE